MERKLVIDSARIIVSANRLIECGYAVNLRVFGTLPRGRKSQLLTWSTCYGTIIWRPLFGHNGEARMSPQAWRHLVNTASVESCDLSPVVITPELAQRVRDELLAFAECECVTDSTHIHPNYRVTWDSVTFPIAPGLVAV